MPERTQPARCCTTRRTTWPRACGEALAADERTNELGIRVDVHGDQVYLRGSVGSAERRRYLTEVAQEAAPGTTVHNECDVVSVRTAQAEEDELL